MEEWKKLYDSDRYEVSSEGEFKSTKRIIKSTVNKNGIHYRTKPDCILSLRTNGIQPYLFSDIYYDEDDPKNNTTVYIARAVADHFVKKPRYIQDIVDKGGKVYASHIVKDYTNNTKDNLMWKSYEELKMNHDFLVKQWRLRVIEENLDQMEAEAWAEDNEWDEHWENRLE